MQHIYLDNSATTALCSKAKEAMLSVMDETWGNPSSRHTMGTAAHAILKRAREQVLSSLGVRGAKEENLIFTASGTEADNLAILGTARAKKALAGGKIITSDSEHPAVLRTVEALEAEGFRAAYIQTKNGIFDMEQFRREMTRDTFLVTVMLVNNETGAVNDIRAISDYAKSVNPDCIIHTDAVQGYLKLPFTPTTLGADLVTISAHKIHGPKGIGALYISPYMIKRRAVSPVIFGGGQEFALRSGTENMIGVAGFGAAAAAGSASMAEDIAKMTALRDKLPVMLADDPILSGIAVNLPQSKERAPHIISMRMPKIKSETMLNFLSGKGIAVSSGSACSAQSGRISSALLCFGLSEAEADTTLRISLCSDNTEEELTALCDALRTGIKMLARMKR